MDAVGPRVPCAGGLVHDADRRLLLIRRGTPPNAGLWSVPGGRCEPGERPSDTAAREVREETGLDVVVGALAGRVERPGLEGATYVIDDFFCRLSTPASAPPVSAGDDAADAGWFTPSEVRQLPCVPGLVDELTRWGALD